MVCPPLREIFDVYFLPPTGSPFIRRQERQTGVMRPAVWMFERRSEKGEKTTSKKR